MLSLSGNGQARRHVGRGQITHFYTAEDLACLLDLSIQSVTGMCRRGVWPGAFKQERHAYGPGWRERWLIPDTDFRAWVAKQAALTVAILKRASRK